MRKRDTLLTFIAKTCLNAVSHGFLGDLLFEVVPKMAREGRGDWASSSTEEERRADLTRLVDSSLTEDGLRQLLLELDPELTEAVARQVLPYLQAIQESARSASFRCSNASDSNEEASADPGDEDVFTSIFPDVVPSMMHDLASKVAWPEKTRMSTDALRDVHYKICEVHRECELDISEVGMSDLEVPWLVYRVLDHFETWNYPGRCLRGLVLRGNSVTATGVAAIVEAFPGLRYLSLSDNPVGDSGVRVIANGLPELSVLVLVNTGITGASLELLAKGRSSNRLHKLVVRGNGVTCVPPRAIKYSDAQMMFAMLRRPRWLRI